MSQYEIDPSPRSGDRTRSLLVGALLVLAFLLVVGGLILLGRAEIAFSPTPTPTATDAPPIPATVDLGATRVAQDMITQEAYPVAVDLGITPLPPSDSAVPPSTGEETTGEQAQIESSQDTAEISLSLPIVSSASQSESLIPTPTSTNPPEMMATPTFIPEEPTQTLEPPTPSPTPTSTPQPTPYTVSRLLAYVQETGVKRRQGPGSWYADNGEFQSGEIWLQSRTSSGEWVYASQNDNAGWIRQVDALPRDNNLPGDAPEGANPNDVRWLVVQSPPGGPDAQPIPSPIPANDFPLVRANRSNQNWVNRVPLPPYNAVWPGGGYDAGQPFSSPVVVADNSVIAANDDRHIYAIDRLGGNQKWRQATDNRVSQSPAIQNSDVFAIDELGIVYAVRETGIPWRTATDMTPSAGITIAGDWLFAVGRSGETPRMRWIRLDNGDIQQTIDESGQPFFLPAIGDQMVYVAGNKVWALESNVIEIADQASQAQRIWEYSDFNGAAPSTPPVYASPGVRSLAELYVGTTAGRIYLLNANTGAFLEWYEGDRAVKSLAIDATRLYAASDDRLRAYSRATRELLWEVGLSARLVSGPISDDDNVIVFQEDGAVKIYNALDGFEGGSHFVPRDLRGGAISNPYFFSSSSDNRMYGLKGQD